MKIAVIGATGTIGSKIAAELEKRGHEVVPISRSHGVDVSSLTDLSAALTGVDVVIDAINNMIMSSKRRRQPLSAPPAISRRRQLITM